MMIGIDLNQPVFYRHASLRFFSEGEHHVTRCYENDILLLVYEGVLRFSENGERREVRAGEFYIQRSGLYQSGEDESDMPKYLYVYFQGEWTDKGTRLPLRGTFDIARLWPTMKKMDAMAHGAYCYAERVRELYTILMHLQRTDKGEGIAHEIADYLSANYQKMLTLEDICAHFNFSKNHVINLFKKEYGMTPFDYISEQRLSRAMYLLEVTSDTIESVAFASGFRDYSHFYRQFCRKNGISPQVWRERIQRSM